MLHLLGNAGVMSKYCPCLQKPHNLYEQLTVGKVINAGKKNTGVTEVQGEEKKLCWWFFICSFAFVIYPSNFTLCPREVVALDSIIWASLSSSFSSDHLIKNPKRTYKGMKIDRKDIIFVSTYFSSTFGRGILATATFFC